MLLYFLLVDYIFVSKYKTYILLTLVVSSHAHVIVPHLISPSSMPLLLMLPFRRESQGVGNVVEAEAAETAAEAKKKMVKLKGGW